MATPGFVLKIVGKINSRVLLHSDNNDKTASVPERVLPQLEKLGVTIEDKPDDYIV